MEFVLHHVRGVSRTICACRPTVNAFLTHLAVDEHVSASIQTQALSALLFLYRHVPGRKAVTRPRHPLPLRTGS